MAALVALTTDAAAAIEPAAPDGGPSPVVGRLAAPATGATGAVPGRVQHSPPSQFRFADPDTITTPGGQYVTYGTSGRSGESTCGTTFWGVKLWMPYQIHGNGESSGFGSCSHAKSGDAMPTGPGAWAEPTSDIWAPTVVRYAGSYLAFYAASRRGTMTPQEPHGQKCIGIASSAVSARGPFVDNGSYLCPADGAWAMDPDAFVHQGELFLTYRDDSVVPYPETALVAIRVDAFGQPDLASRKVLVTSLDVSWDTPGSALRIIENPSLLRVGNPRSGYRWLLAFSGNDWFRTAYAVGLADCGPRIFLGGRCEVLDDTERAYFGFPNPASRPRFGLPLHKRGPGGMSLFRTPGGSARAVWHFIGYEGVNPPRRSIIGRLSRYRGRWQVS